jgi:hypothetical protein
VSGVGFRRWLTASAFDGVPAAPAAPLAAAAGAVALARRSPGGHSTPAFGFGPPLAPFEVPDELAAFWTRDAAMALPTVSRSRDLLVSAVSALPFTFWRVSREPDVDPVAITAPVWADRPDPNRTRQWMVAWTTDDLFFFGVAHWHIVARDVERFPTAFERITPGDLGTTSDGGLRIGTTPVPAADVVEFLSPVEGILANGYRPISIAWQLDAAAERFAACEVPAGVLEEQDHGGEDLSADELTELADVFAAARSANTTAATNRYVRYREVDYDASKMQVVEGRTYQALELARLSNVPGYLVGAPAGTGMTYLNAQQAREDLITFGAAPLIGCLEQTLSGPNVTPRGQAVVMDQRAWLRNPFTAGDPTEPTDPTPQPSTDGDTS